MSSNSINFTKATLLDLPLPPHGKRKYFRDTKEKGLIIDVRSTGSKSFYLYKRINGRPERMFLGTFPDFTVENARRDAAIYKGQIADGDNPQDQKRQIRKECTFGSFFSQYMERYSKPNKKSWRYDEREVNKFLSHWFTRKLSDIRRTDVQLMHEKIHRENGLYQANRILERIRAIYNKSIEWGWEGLNPATGIKKYKEKSRDRFILPHEMPYFIQAIEQERNHTARDYFLILLLTGARKTNALQMRWQDVDFDTEIWRIPDSKNGEPINIPLLTKAIEILKKRKETAVSSWVFASSSEETRHFTNSKRAWQRALKRATIAIWSESNNLKPIIEQALMQIHDVKLIDHFYDAIIKIAVDQKVDLPTGLMDVHLHDLRRTVGSYQAINGTSLEIIGKSLGHKSHQATKIYSRLTLSPVRVSMEQAMGHIFSPQVSLQS